MHPKIRFESEVVNDYPSWGKQPLGNIILKMSSGLSRQLKTENVGLAVIRSNNMADKYTTNKDIKYWYEDDPQGANTSNYILEEGDILVNFINSLSQIGKTSLFRKLPNTNAIYTTNILRLKLNPSQVNELFFFYFTKTVTFETYIRAITKPAVNQASFTTKEFVQLEVPLPCLQEQQKIADFLTSVDTKISQLTEKHCLLKDYKKGVMQQIFSQQIRFKDDDGNTFPEWNTHELAMLSESGISNGVFNDPKKVGKGFRLINVKDMYKGDSIEYSELTLLDLEPKLFEKNKVKYGDIFFTRSSIVPTGIAFSNVNLSEKEDITFDGHLMKISPNKKLVDPLFLAYYLRSYAPRKALVSRGKQSTMTTIAQDDIKDIKLNIPALKEQQKIAQFLQSLDKKINAVNEQIEQTKLFKKGLLQQMFV